MDFNKIGKVDFVIAWGQNDDSENPYTIRLKFLKALFRAKDLETDVCLFQLNFMFLRFLLVSMHNVPLSESQNKIKYTLLLNKTQNERIPTRKSC